MKKRFFLCMISVMMIGAITGCQKADEEVGSTDIGTHETEEIETGEKAHNKGGSEVEESHPSGTEKSLNDTAENDGEKMYSIEEYGTVEEKQQEYLEDGTDDVSYYYRMENFFFNANLPNAASVNHTLQQLYDEYEGDYIEGAKAHTFNVEEASDTPYSYWHILSIEYVGEDYVSILYNDVSYMGGAHPYSRLDGITVDCKTGEQVSAAQFLGKSDEEILTEISSTMGFASIGTWDDVDFYLTDSTIVFFYRMPGFWEDVVLQREN